MAALYSVLVVNTGAFGLPNGLGRTPAMGYNSWYDLMCTDAMNETTIRRRADFMVSSGLQDAGYSFVNLDDCFVTHRDENDGTLQPDPQLFPSGMRALSDALHKMNLKFGVYTDRGNETCAGRPAAKDHEILDARTYAHDWQIDYLKEDSCHATADHSAAFSEYGTMRDALNSTGRPIYFSLCGWNDWYAPHGASLGNSWRIGPDDTNWKGVLTNIDIMAPLGKFAGPGGWNDPCLLLSKAADGTLAITELQSRAQFSMWAVLAAPLLISGMLAEEMSPFVLQTYLNKLVIAVSQDPLGRQGVRVAGGDLSDCATGLGSRGGMRDATKGDIAATACTNVWSRRLAGAPGSAALVFLNAASNTSQEVRCDAACWARAGFSQADFPLTSTDLWTGEALPPILSADFTSKILHAAGGVQMIQVRGQPKASDVPHISIPPCSPAGGFARVDDFSRDDLNRSRPATRPFVAATQATSFSLCHTPAGLRILGNATDDDIFNTATRCNDPVYKRGDVLEVFVAPVAELTDVPSWYLEVDSAASGALYSQLTHNRRNAHWVNIGGNATAGTDCALADAMRVCASPCNASAMTACFLKCTGAASFVKGMHMSTSSGDGWWAIDLFVPWALFPSRLIQQRLPGGKVWPNWRLNFYRYDYHSRMPSGQWDHEHFELSAWSASGLGNFHTPSFFGTAELV